LGSSGGSIEGKEAPEDPNEGLESVSGRFGDPLGMEEELTDLYTEPMLSLDEFTLPAPLLAPEEVRVDEACLSAI